MRTHAIILIADDDADIRANFSDILSDRGYIVDVAPDGHAALARIKERQYDVAILDFKMPGMDGATLYTSVKKMYPELVAIMVTAYAGGDGAQRALDAGVAHVLRKPVEMSQLLERVVRQRLHFRHVTHFLPGQAFESDQEGAGRPGPLQGSAAAQGQEPRGLSLGLSASRALPLELLFAPALLLLLGPRLRIVFGLLARFQEVDGGAKVAAEIAPGVAVTEIIHQIG